jgi:hypothetical protein
MASRWEKQALKQVVMNFDPLAIGGCEIRIAGLDSRVFDARPESHAEPTASECRRIYESMSLRAMADGRLTASGSLVRNHNLTFDIYSPKLRRFIEIDEKQHFTEIRLSRLYANRLATWAPLYAVGFWQQSYPRLVKSPRRDLDPPHRDEARAYRDEMRDRLPVVYGFRRTIRLDEFTLKALGIDRVSNLLNELIETDKSIPEQKLQ